MKKFTFTALMLAAALSTNAQNTVADSVEMGAGYANDIYYKLTDGTKDAQVATNWHLAFKTNVYSSTIWTNPNNTVVAKYPNGTNADFNVVDTAGFSTWTKVFNDSIDWDLGALNRNASGNMDYGWGSYNTATHILNGHSVFIVKDGETTYKVEIVKRQSGTYTIKFADVATATGTTIEIPATQYATKEFVYFNLATGTIVDRELEGWDIMATKFHDQYNGVPDQVVTGILTHPKWEVAVIETTDQAGHSASSDGTFVEDKNELGSSYKYLTPSYQWAVVTDRVYYLQNAAGDVWKWYPVSFKGTGFGRTVFNKQKVATAGLTENGTTYLEVYPNPSADQITLAFDSKSAETTIALRNQLGQVVLQEVLSTSTGMTQHKLDISTMTPGVYFLEINQNGTSTVKNIVKL